jgi:hypothetical protein
MASSVPLKCPLAMTARIAASSVFESAAYRDDVPSISKSMQTAFVSFIGVSVSIDEAHEMPERYHGSSAIVKGNSVESACGSLRRQVCSSAAGVFLY